MDFISPLDVGGPATAPKAVTTTSRRLITSPTEVNVSPRRKAGNRGNRSGDIATDRAKSGKANSSQHSLPGFPQSLVDPTKAAAALANGEIGDRLMKMKESEIFRGGVKDDAGNSLYKQLWIPLAKVAYTGPEFDELFARAKTDALESKKLKQRIAELDRTSAYSSGVSATELRKDEEVQKLVDGMLDPLLSTMNGPLSGDGTCDLTKSVVPAPVLLFVLGLVDAIRAWAGRTKDSLEATVSNPNANLTPAEKTEIRDRIASLPATQETIMKNTLTAFLGVRGVNAYFRKPEELDDRILQVLSSRLATRVQNLSLISNLINCSTESRNKLTSRFNKEIEDFRKRWMQLPKEKMPAARQAEKSSPKFRIDRPMAPASPPASPRETVEKWQQHRSPERVESAKRQRMAARLIDETQLNTLADRFLAAFLYAEIENLSRAQAPLTRTKLIDAFIKTVSGYTNSLKSDGRQPSLEIIGLSQVLKDLKLAEETSKKARKLERTRNSAESGKSEESVKSMESGKVRERMDTVSPSPRTLKEADSGPPGKPENVDVSDTSNDAGNNAGNKAARTDKADKADNQQPSND